MLSQTLRFAQYPKMCPITKRDTKLPLTNSTLLNCDWLSFSCLSRGNFLETSKFLLDIEPAEHGTQRFNKLYYLKHLNLPNEVFAELQAEPRPKFLDKNLVIIKLANRFLYSSQLRHYVETICNELNLQFKYLSRLDLALDFQHFPKQKEMSPHDFFEKIASRSFKMRSHKSIAAPYKDEQNVTARGRKIRQLTFGSRRSPVYIVMYNKSLEMRQKKFKPYIFQSWEKCGFDKEKDTFRLEFSIKLKQDFVDKTTGETINKTDFSILEHDNLKKVFKSYYTEHFRVVKNDNERLQRCTPVELFNLSENAFLRLDLSDKKDSHIHIKSQIKRMVERLENMNIEEKERMSDGLSYYLSEMVHVHYLHQWFSRKFPEQKLPEYQPPAAVLGQQITLFNN